jgi:hypothetical protein
MTLNLRLLICLFLDTAQNKGRKYDDMKRKIKSLIELQMKKL